MPGSATYVQVAFNQIAMRQFTYTGTCDKIMFFTCLACFVDFVSVWH